MPRGALRGRAGSILDAFPGFMRANASSKALARIALALGSDLDDAEARALGVQRSHRLAVADEERDLFALAALLGLQPADFFLVRRLYERGVFAKEVVAEAGGAPLPDQEREARAYARYADELRDLVGRMGAVLFEGCGTIWALLEGAAILLDADRLDAQGRPDPGARLVEHLDAGLPRGGFLHRLRVAFRLLGDDGEPAVASGAVYLLENPVVDRQTDEVERRQRERFRVRRGGFFDGPVAVEIAGFADRTVGPMVIDVSNHRGFGYAGVVGDGQKLVFTAEGKALLDGVDVTARAYAFEGALYGESPFDGDPPRDVAVVTGRLREPLLRLGESDWRFSVEEGAFDAATFDEAVFALPTDPGALQALPPSGKVRLRWREHEPFAAVVLIPAELKSLEEPVLDGQDLRKLLRAGLERFRPAGVRLGVEYFEEDWVLGHSILRDLAAPPGEGVNFDGTVPGDLPQ